MVTKKSTNIDNIEILKIIANTDEVSENYNTGIKEESLLGGDRGNVPKLKFDFQKISTGKTFINERINGRIKSIEKLKQKFMNVENENELDVKTGSFDLFQKSKSVNYLNSGKQATPSIAEVEILVPNPIGPLASGGQPARKKNILSSTTGGYGKGGAKQGTG
jgi:hypothetical protein